MQLPQGPPIEEASVRRQLHLPRPPAPSDVNSGTSEVECQWGADQLGDEAGAPKDYPSYGINNMDAATAIWRVFAKGAHSEAARKRDPFLASAGRGLSYFN